MGLREAFWRRQGRAKHAHRSPTPQTIDNGGTHTVQPISRHFTHWLVASQSLTDDKRYSPTEPSNNEKNDTSHGRT